MSDTPVGHPIHILMEEHRILLQNATELKNITQGLKYLDSISREMERIKRIEDYLNDSESHYVREENVLFPYLEKHGVTQPPAMMWTEHQKIREVKKSLFKLIDEQESMDHQDVARRLDEVAASLADLLSSHFYKENNVLFPTALQVIMGDEWRDIRSQFDELGYCCFTPENAKSIPEELKARTLEDEEKILFGTGELSKEELEAVLDTLPVDITFVDKEDVVRYFSKSKDRIFTRTKAVIGRKVQLCHPEKSVHIVNRILEDFRSGRRDTAEFWIRLGERYVYIRYFAVRDNVGDYLGCVEVTQDIAGIMRIEGERRLLDD